MNDSAKKKLAEQVAGKIHWGATREEVLEWLLKEKRISTEEAERLIALGFQERRGEVRSRAILRLSIAALGFLLFAGFLYLQYAGQFIMVGPRVLIVWALGLGSIGVIGHSLYEIVTGNSDRPM